MKRFAAAACVAIAAVVAEIVLPGHAVYHSGWYNVALSALLAVVVVTGRKRLPEAPSLRARLAIVAVIFGATAAGLAGVANGLFAPDDRDFVGAPGERVQVEALGTLFFPLSGQGSGADVNVTLERHLHAPMEIGARAGNAGSFILRTLPRDVVYVEARDLRENELTVTQPEGTVFLSPVLLMQHRQTIAGINVPFDSFNVPAARRVVKAILFTPAQAALLAQGQVAPGLGAVLFAVDDAKDRPLPHGIALSAGGQPVRAGSLWLRAEITSYPQVEVVAVPNVAVVTIGALLAIVGALVTLVSRHDRANVAQHDAPLR